MLKAILACVNGPRDETDHRYTETPQWNKAEEPHQPQDALLAHKIIDAMQNADKTSEELRMGVSDVVHANNWTESLANAVLARLDDGIKTGMIKKEGPLKDAFDKAVAAAVGFAREHPVWATLIALGILVELLPWVVEALGFGELGPVAGSFAAWWQARYAGYVPIGSLFSFFQRLGMAWKH